MTHLYIFPTLNLSRSTGEGQTYFCGEPLRFGGDVSPAGGDRSCGRLSFRAASPASSSLNASAVKRRNFVSASTEAEILRKVNQSVGAAAAVSRCEPPLRAAGTRRLRAGEAGSAPLRSRYEPRLLAARTSKRV